MMEKEIFEVLLDDIIPNRFQPRERFEQEALKDLAESIKQYGLIQPIVVRRLGDKYEIIAGERRYKASSMAGLEKIPVVIKNLGDAESAEVALVENIQRQGLTPIEEARSYDKLLDISGDTQEALAKKLGVAQPTVANKIRLLNLSSKVQEALLNKKISERHARGLLKLKTKEEQDEMLNNIIEKRLTVRQLDDEISKKIVINKVVPVEGEKQMPKEEIEPVVTAPETPIVENVEILSKPGPVIEVPLPKVEKEPRAEEPTQIQKEEQPQGVFIESQPVSKIPEIKVEIPVIEEEKEPPTSERIAPVVTPEININQEKAVAKDINIDVKKPNFDMLLKPDVDSVDTEPIQEVPSEGKVTEVIKEQPEGKFINDLEDEETNMASSLPETNVSSLIQEYREENGIEKPIVETPSLEEIPIVVEPVAVAPVPISIEPTPVPVEPVIAPPVPVVEPVQASEEPTGDEGEKLPKVPIIESIVKSPLEQPMVTEPIVQPESSGETFVTGDLRTAINTVRQCIDTVEKYGFSVDSEEFDFENMYQIIIKVEKK